METKVLEILVMEDDQKHLADAKTTLQKAVEKGVVKVDYATSYQEAESMLKSKEYDGFIIGGIYDRPLSKKEDEILTTLLGPKRMFKTMTTAYLIDYHDGRGFAEKDWKEAYEFVIDEVCRELQLQSQHSEYKLE